MKYFWTIFILGFSIFTNAQETQKIKVFYDCNTFGCDDAFVKQNLPAVAFVRDHNYADVYILIVSEANGSGGSTYHLDFVGQNNFKNIQEKLDFSTGTDTTQEQLREKLLKYLKLGLMKFWIKNGLVDKISLQIKTDSKNIKEKDRWNNWVFKIGVNG